MIFQPLNIVINNQQTIKLTFSLQPSLFLTKANFIITSTSSGVSDLDILSIEIESFVITLNTRPMFPNNLYLLQLIDLPTQAFESTANIELSMLTDARSIYFVGVEDINTTRNTMLQNLPSNYDVSEQTLVYDVISTLANEINKTSIALFEIQNDNFISIPIVDELYFRGSGPEDRLKNEGVFNVSRVAKTLTGTSASSVKSFDPTIDPNIPFEVINLRAMNVVETIPNGISNNKFDGFLLNVTKAFVTKLIFITLNPGNISYDPAKFGYMLLNNNYDRFARKNPILKSNQILLSPLTNNAFPEPIPGDTLVVEYEFDNVGRRVDKNTISLYSVLKSINESVPANTTSFFLTFSNIVGSNGNTLTLNGVRFQVSTINLSTHPSFLHEIIFNTDSLPSASGEYAINYITGQVFVFGTQIEMGTGKTPPVASYFYKNIAIPNIDYFINADGYNVSLNSFSQFAAQPFFISFLYEDVLSPGVDYLIDSHIEVLNERINNKLISDFGIEVSNTNVKEVYQILNETTGESYTPGLIENNHIFFTGNTPPATSTTLGELAAVGNINDEILNVVVIATIPNRLLRLFQITLSQHPVLNQRLDGIGANFNSSIQLTRQDVFLNELYFNPFDSLQLNLDKLRLIGDYLIDYANGNLYLAVSNSQNFDIGHISYSYGVFIPNHTHVLAVSSIGLGTTSTDIIQELEVGKFSDGLIIPKLLNYGYDTFDGKSMVPNSDGIFIAQLQDDFTLYTKYPIKKVYGVFTQNDVDAYGATIINGKNLYNSSINSFANTIIDLKTYVILPIAADLDPNYYNVVIPDNTGVIKSIVIVDTNVQLLDLPLYAIKYTNIIIKSVVPLPAINPTTANVILQNVITLLNPSLDSLVDTAGHRFQIVSIVGGNNLTVTVPSFIPPVVNVGSQILNQNGILVADHLAIISVTELPDLLYIVHYDVFPAGILTGYQIKDSNNNVFTITDIQVSSVVVAVINTNVIPIVDLLAKIETQALLVANTPTINTTTLKIPIDAPITINTNIKIGYVPDKINNAIIAANLNTNAAGGAGLTVDYSIGQFFLNYTHLDDELLVSYDYGDNQLNWSISDTLHSGDPYYASYQYGASRNGLETNFGILTNVDFLQNAPLSISRETYRTAVSAAIKSFLKGPTHEAIRSLVYAFTQINPDITESILNQWVLGRDPLSLTSPINTGQILFGNGKYDDGLIISNDSSIQLPGMSSIRLSQGTFSTWFRPNWRGNQADDFINFILPTETIAIYYNAHNVLPQDTELNNWNVNISTDAYGNAYAFNNYLEIRNSKNTYIGTIPQNNVVDNTTSIELHQNMLSFSYETFIGTYLWNRLEPTLSLANDIDINFSGYVSALKSINQSANVVNVSSVLIDDGYNKYSTGFYLFKRGTYFVNVVLEDVHLSIAPPFPHYSPSLIVSTIAGSSNVSVISGDTNTLSNGQQIIIGTAFPNLTNIIGFNSTTIVMRGAALTTQTNVVITNLDPPSTIGTNDGYGEIHLDDKLGTRLPNTQTNRTNGWERQLLVKVTLSPFTTNFLMIVGSNDPPLSTQTPIIDLMQTIVPGIDVFVDGYNSVFEVDHIELPYIWLKKPAASGEALPTGILAAFRKVAGVLLPDNFLASIPTNWSTTTLCSLTKRNGTIVVNSNEDSTTASYVMHDGYNSGGISKISFGLPDANVDAIVRIESVNYNIYSIFTHNDIYIGNTAINPTTDMYSFKYDLSTTGIPAINKNKYCAIFTDVNDAANTEPIDEVFVKIKIPSSWTLVDNNNATATFNVNPMIQFSANTSGDIIAIVDAYGMNYVKINDYINLTAIDTSSYVSGHSSILLDNGPELRISAGKRHYLFDVEGGDGALRLYRNGEGLMIAEVNSNNSIFTIRSNIASWNAGEIHHIAMSWKINSPDNQDELHLFIDGDEVPNEVTFGSGIQYALIGDVYAEPLSVVFRVASTNGFIVNDSNGSGVFIPNTNLIQPDPSWINRTIVLNATIPGPNVYLNEPLIVGAIVAVVGGQMLFLSQNSVQINFSMYGPSVPILYGLATYSIAQITLLTRTNFGVFVNNIELMGPTSITPQFRQVGDTQIIELYNTINGQYIENTLITDNVAIKTYGLLSESIKDSVYQFGSLIRNIPISVDTITDNTLISTNVAIVAGDGAFITDLPAPVDPVQVKVTKVLLPRIMI